MAGFFSGHRICHHSDEAICAGFWERHKDDFAMGQLAGRLGLVEKVDHKMAYGLSIKMETEAQDDG
jgi:hypothetical protein